MKIGQTQYERLMLTIFFETLTILCFILFYNKATTLLRFFIFIETVMLFQSPFMSFIIYDFIKRRQSLVDNIIKVISVIITWAIIFGVFLIAIIIDPKSGLSGTVLFFAIQCYRYRDQIKKRIVGKK